jgi:hypothetical protein
VSPVLFIVCLDLHHKSGNADDIRWPSSNASCCKGTANHRIGLSLEALQFVVHGCCFDEGVVKDRP